MKSMLEIKIKLLVATTEKIFIINTCKYLAYKHCGKVYNTTKWHKNYAFLAYF